MKKIIVGSLLSIVSVSSYGLDIHHGKVLLSLTSNLDSKRGVCIRTDPAIETSNPRNWACADSNELVNLRLLLAQSKNETCRFELESDASGIPLIKTVECPSRDVIPPYLQ